MRHYESPFNGKRYILNKSTGEIHDLDNEKPQCQINKIATENIYACDTYEEAQVHAILVENHANPNGCFYCNLSKDNG